MVMTQDLALNETSTPDSPALYATFVRMEDVDVMELSDAVSIGYPSAASLSATLVVAVALSFFCATWR